MAADSVRDDSQGTRQTFLYFGWLTLFVYLVTPVSYLVDIQTSYMLKNHLHATATQVSIFRLVTAIPVYISFAFGLVRDMWNPFGLRDRGFFLIFAPITAAAFFWIAIAPITYRGLVISMLVLMVSFRFVTAAYQGLIALVGQEKLMSGRLSALWQIVALIPYFFGAYASGYISEHLGARGTFSLIALATLMIVVFAFWKPNSVFGHAYEKPQAAKTGFVSDLKRLAKHKAIYPAVVIMLMFNFSPGSATPLQFYLTNTLHASDAIYSYFNAIFVISFIPTIFLYGMLCKKVSLNKLLWWGMIIGVPQMIPLAFIHSAYGALWAAAPIGLMGGLIATAIYDLSMRSCPPGLQGTLMMLIDGALLFAQRSSDLLGAKIYNSSPEHGFLYCVIAITVVYALILPVIALVPKELTATRDGEVNPAAESKMLSEIAES